MNIHMSKRLFVVAAVLGAVAVFATGFFVAQGVRSVVAGPDSAPAASAPNPGHSWSEIGDLPGTMWHSNNDGSGSGLDADLLDGLDSTAFSTGPHTTSLPWSSITTKPAGFADDVDDDILGGLSCANGEIAKWGGSAWQCGADVDTDTQLSEGQVETYVTNGPLDLDAATTLGGASISTGPHTTSLPWSAITGLPGTMWHSNNDGSGSGLDADTVDGAQASALEESAEIDADIAAHASNASAHHTKTTSASEIVSGTMSPDRILGTAWTSLNDGPGSGLDADRLDGQHGTYYRDANNINTGTLSTSRYSARNDLSAEGHLGNASGDIAQNNGTLQSNLNADEVDGYDASAFWRLGGNSVGSTGILGTSNNYALDIRVNNARALRLEPDAISPNVIGGYMGNSVTAGAYGATIGGGGESGSGHSNRVTDDYGTVGGGRGNQAGDADPDSGNSPYATVGGGYRNIASGSTATVGGGDSNFAGNMHATVGGGSGNAARDTNATVGGGRWNTASNGFATVGGGWQNTASGDSATIPGGAINTAQGNYSFAAGRRAKANHQGAFVWGDSTNADVASTGNNEFKIRASGGVHLYTNSTLSSGCLLGPGSGTWSCSSDRNLKDNFTPVDGQEVLASLAAIPIATWNYEAQDASIRHMGPVAQDFYAAFGLGESDTSISSVDTDGVALAAIQALYELSQEQDARIDALEARVAALEGEAGTSGGSAGSLSSAMPAGWLLFGGLVLGGLVLVQRRRAGGRR